MEAQEGTQEVAQMAAIDPREMEVKTEELSLAPIEHGELAIFLDPTLFGQAWRASRLLASSSLVPDHYKGKEANAFVALSLARRLDLDVFMVMQKTYVVGGRIGFEAQFSIAMVNSRGPFTGPIEWRFEGAGDQKKCFAYATHRKTGKVCEAECSIQMAKDEGWYEKRTRDGREMTSKWKTMPDMMLRYRSAAFLARLYCPEVLMGLSTVDELHDMPVIEAKAEEKASAPAPAPALEPPKPFSQTEAVLDMLGGPPVESPTKNGNGKKIQVADNTRK